MGLACSACSASTGAARAWRSAWTTASSASSWMRTAAKASASSAGKCPTAPRSMRWRQSSSSTRSPPLVGQRPRAARRVKDLIIFHDPVGNRLEIFHGAETTTEPFRPGRSISGFRTGPLGLGHVVLHVQNVDDIMPFYRDVLGFRLSDYYFHPFTAFFLHINPRHHSIAFIQTGRNAVHHMMMELFSFDDVGQGYDLAMAEEGRLAVTLGRHTSDFLTSFYTQTPSGFMVEYGWGGRGIDPATWQASQRNEGPSMWGHERIWLSPEDRAKARDLRLKLASEGYRRPVQVMEGNHELAPGVCPWWDSVKARAVG